MDGAVKEGWDVQGAVDVVAAYARAEYEAMGTTFLEAAAEYVRVLGEATSGTAERQRKGKMMAASSGRENQRSIWFGKPKPRGKSHSFGGYLRHCQQLENNAQVIKTQLEEKIKDTEFLLLESRKRMKELEAASESKFQIWNKKEYAVQNFIGFQLESVKNLRLESECIKREVIKTQNGWKEEMNGLGVKLKVLVDAVENYHTVLTENKKLYNEVQDLKGNIRVYLNLCGFQPLVRSVLDGYNVCIFAYGQTRSGKTYTMVPCRSGSPLR